MLKHSGTRADGKYSFTIWKAKSFRDRIRFLFTGKLTVIERGLTSTKKIEVGVVTSVSD
jgi:hypothetical protein